jgi:glycosyltransferase involved in cell wall biosynthesis
MLPDDRFFGYDPGRDPVGDCIALLRLDDLEPKFPVIPKASVLLSTWNRRSQLMRTVETLARQTFKDFELILLDDGSTQDIASVAATFNPYLTIKYVRLERTQWRSDPLHAFQIGAQLIHPSSEVIIFAQPEIMLTHTAVHHLYYDCFQPPEQYSRLRLSQQPIEGEYKDIYVTLRCMFFSEYLQRAIDLVDWHTDTNNLQKLPEFWRNADGFAGQQNSHWYTVKDFLWWFTSSMTMESFKKYIKDFPERFGHAQIDFFLMNVRKTHNMLDITPWEPIAYHQFHHRTAIGREKESQVDFNG